jgi:hypothetical protein
VGDFPSHLVRAPARPRFGRAKALTIWLVTVAACLTLTSANAAPISISTGSAITGLKPIGSPPAGPSWAPAPVTASGLSSLATAADGRYALHTAGGTVTFLPGVDLGSTTPGHLPGELAITAEQYESWFAAMAWLGIRVVRIVTIHPPAFYRQLAAHNQADPKRPLYLMQGVYPPDETVDPADPAATSAFRQESRDAAGAVAGDLARDPRAGRADGTWTADVTPWLLGWIIGTDLDPDAVAASDRRHPDVPMVSGRYFTNSVPASPTERRLAAQMNELATLEAARGLSQPIAFRTGASSGPLRLDANHVRATAAWPGGTFAAVPYSDDLAAARRHYGDRPAVVIEFGVPSSLGSAPSAPGGRAPGGHTEEQAMAIDARLLREIHAQGLAGAFLAEWTDQWYRSAWNTVDHQDPDRRQLWHDPLTSTQHYGLIATEAAGPPDAATVFLLDDENARPARRVIARIDESFVRLRIVLGGSRPRAVTLSFDVLPALTGEPPPGSRDRWADMAFTLDLVALTGQAYVREQLDPVQLDDARVPASARGPAPPGWQRAELLVSRETPTELQNVGDLRYGELWSMTGDELTVQVPWALLGYADPSSHEVAVPLPGRSAVAPLTTQISPGVGVTVSASGTDQQAGEVTWVNWNRVAFTERLKRGASAFRDAALDVTR